MNQGQEGQENKSYQIYITFHCLTKNYLDSFFFPPSRQNKSKKKKKKKLNTIIRIQSNRNS